MMFYRSLWYLLLLFSSASFSSVEIREFASPEQEKQYQQLINELRCLVCQNQNIADSDADLAKDLRQKTYELVVQNQSPEQIRRYMQQRFGDFVLYAPPLNSTTVMLWAMPIFVLLLSLVLFIRKLTAHQTNLLSE